MQDDPESVGQRAEVLEIALGVDVAGSRQRVAWVALATRLGCQDPFDASCDPFSHPTGPINPTDAETLRERTTDRKVLKHVGERRRMVGVVGGRWLVGTRASRRLLLVVVVAVVVVGVVIVVAAGWFCWWRRVRRTKQQQTTLAADSPTKPPPALSSSAPPTDCRSLSLSLSLSLHLSCFSNVPTTQLYILPYPMKCKRTNDVNQAVLPIFNTQRPHFFLPSFRRLT